MFNSVKVFDELPGGDILQYVSTNVTTLSFPEKLMYMMMSVEKATAGCGGKGSSAAIAWNHEGTAIIVLNSEELEDIWFPRFFGSNCKFKSFTRKMYRWGFKRLKLPHHAAGDLLHCNTTAKVVKNPHQGCFQHVHFQRDHKNLLYKMENTTSDKTQRTMAKQQRQRPWTSWQEYPSLNPAPLKSPPTAVNDSSFRHPNEERFVSDTNYDAQHVDPLVSSKFAHFILQPPPVQKEAFAAITNRLVRGQQEQISRAEEEHMLAYNTVLVSSLASAPIPSSSRDTFLEQGGARDSSAPAAVRVHNAAVVDIIDAYSSTSRTSSNPENEEGKSQDDMDNWKRTGM